MFINRRITINLWDEEEAAEVKRAHHVEFARIIEIFSDSFAIEFEDVVHSIAVEVRYAVIRLTSYGLVCLVYTKPSPDGLHFITARRAEKKHDGQETQALGQSRGGFSTKIHVAVDALGNPLRFILTGGECHESPHAPALIEGYSMQVLIGDEGYDATDFIKALIALGVEAVIPPRVNRKGQRQYDKHLSR